MLLRLIRDFLRRENGNIALIMTIAMVPMVMTAGASIDFVRAHLAKTSLQQAVDAAGLAGSANPDATDAEMFTMVQNFLDANAAGLVVDTPESKVTTTEVNGARRVNIKTTANLDTIFLRTMSVDKLKVTIDTSIQRSELGGLHVALVLDITESMRFPPSTGGVVTKFESLRTASVNLVNELMSSTRADTRIAVVPYSGYVRVRTIADASSQPAPSWILPLSRTDSCSVWAPPAGPPTCLMQTCMIDGVSVVNGCPSPNQAAVCYWRCINNNPVVYNWTGCVGPRVRDTDGQTITDKYLTTLANPTSPRYPGVPRNTWHCPNQPILELTANKTAVVDRINAIVPATSSSNTYMPSGLTWGWDVLTPGIPYDNSLAADLLKKGGRKAMVLFTDGINTMNYNPADGYLRDVSGAARAPTNALTSTLCENIKKDGILLFTVAFDVNDVPTQTLLRNCASGADMAFTASDGKALIKAFGSIGNQLRNVKLTQ